MRNINIPFSLRLPTNSHHHPSIESISLEVKVYRLQNKHLDTITEHLEKNPYPPKGSVLEMMMDQYHRAGWTNSTLTMKKKKTLESASIGFSLEQPSMSFLYYYTLLGISMDPLEALIQEHYPEFSLTQFLIDLSKQYNIAIDSLFPSHRHEISNRLSPEVIRHTNDNNNKKKKKRRVDENDEEVEEEGMVDLIEEIIERKRENESRRERKERHQKRIFGRILPISILPMFLSRLPDFYQEVNISLSLCEQVETLLWNSMVLHKYDSYVADQVRLLRQNRKFLAMEYQSFRFIKDQQTENYEIILLENEILQRQLCDEEYKEVEEYCQRLIVGAIKNKRSHRNNNRGSDGEDKEGQKKIRVGTL